MLAGKAPTVFAPRNLNDLLALKSRKPDVTLFAGGTHLLHGDNRKYPSMPDSIAYIGHIEELKRIHRTERFLEVGTCVSLSKISSIGGRSVPRILQMAIQSIANPPVRSTATLGGNICAHESRLTLFPVLFILDARIELREANGSRWIPINRFAHQDGDLDLSPREVATRIRIPLGEWNINSFRKLSAGSEEQDDSLSFCGLAWAERGVLSDFRFSFGSIGKHLIRNREIEAELVSRKLPIPGREQQTVCQEFDDWLNATYSMLSLYQRSMATKLLGSFLSSLDLH